MIQKLDYRVNDSRKYKLIVEETYKYESKNPEEIQKIIEGYVNYI